MRLWPKSLKWRALVIALLALTAAGVVGYGLFKIEIDHWLNRQAERSRLRDSPDPLLRALALGEIRGGLTADEFVATYPPSSTNRYGRYEAFRYENEVVVVAKDGRLVCASVCNGEHHLSFFQVISDRELLKYTADDLHEYLDESNQDRRLDIERKRWHLHNEDDAHSAVAGVAGYTSTAGWLRERAGLKRQQDGKP